MDGNRTPPRRGAWNKGKLVGQKAPFKLQEIWAIRIRLQMQGRLRDLALFDLGIDSKLRACDLVRLRVRDVCHGDGLAGRAIVLQQKTQRPVEFEIAPPTREALEAWIKLAGLKSDSFLFPSTMRIGLRGENRIAMASNRNIRLILGSTARLVACSAGATVALSLVLWLV